MSDIKRKYPLMTPDTIRQKTHIDKSFFDLHTSKEKGYEHTNKTQYVGNVQNWGSELLLETRKLRQRKPPIGDIHINPGMAYRFNMKYADEPSTYLQDCPIAISLKDIGISNKKMYLLFEDCEPMYIPRPLDDGEVDTYKQLVWKTSIPPKLYGEDSPGSDTFSTYTEIQVSDDNKIADSSSVQVTYWFHNTSSVVDTNIDELKDNETLMNRMMIEEITPYVSQTTGKTVYRIKSVNIEKWAVDIPLVWVTLSDRTDIPEFEMTNNVDKNGYPLLVPGIDGNGNYRLYPFVYGEDNIPPASDDLESSWAIRVLSSENEEFKRGVIDETNARITLSKIQFVRYRKGGNPVTVEDHYEAIDLTWDIEKIRITVNRDWIVPSKYGWFTFAMRYPDEWDFDGVLYHNPIIGIMTNYQDLHKYVRNNVIPPMFDMHIVEYKIYDWNWLSKNVNGGIHVDYTTNYSHNGVIKKNGTIFNYGDADGLPPYFYYKLPRSVHRAHTELYLGRDSITDPNQNVENEQFVSLIVDAAVPQTEIESNIDDFGSVIVYRYDRLYHTDTTTVEMISPNNAISDVGYVSRELSADVTISDYNKCKRFIYHGHRTFSLDMMGLDPILEYGRVYLSSNESTDYVNNKSATKPKPDRTVARICDIPTDLSQLISIKMVSPTLLIDPRYTRTEANFSKEDRSRVLQMKNDGVFIRGRKQRPDRYPELVYESKDILTAATDKEYLTDKFPSYTKLDESIMIEPYIDTSGPLSPYGNEYNWTVMDSDKNFQVGDVLKGYIGGRVIRGVVKTVSSSGMIRELDDGGLYDEDSEYNTDPITIPILNLTSRSLYIQLTVESRYSTSTGSVAYVMFLISDEEWASLLPEIDGPVENIHALYKDENGNMFITKWDNEVEVWTSDYQLIGPEMVYNIYDDPSTRSDRRVGSIMIYSDEQAPIIISDYSYDIITPTGYTDEKIISFETGILYIEGNSYDDVVKDAIMNNGLYQYWAYYSTYDSTTDPYGDNVPTTYIDIHDVYYHEMDSRSKKQINPRYNAYLGYADPHPSSYLVFDNMTSGFLNDYGVEKQPNVFIYNPIATTYEKMYESTNDIMNIGSSVNITFKDLDENIVYDNKSSIILKRDVWKSTAFELKTDATTKRVYRPNVDDDGGITNAPLRQIGTAGTIVARYKDGKPIPDGEQPTGAYKPLSARQYPMHYSFDKVQDTTTDLVYFFKIDDENLTSLLGFKMIDQYTGIDISSKSIILFNGKLYVYKNNRWISTNRYN